MKTVSPKNPENGPKWCRVTGCDGFTRSKIVEFFSKGVLENPSPSVTRHHSPVVDTETSAAIPNELPGVPDVLPQLNPDVPGDAPDVPAWLSPELSRQQQWRAARLDGQRQARERAQQNEVTA